MNSLSHQWRIINVINYTKSFTWREQIWKVVIQFYCIFVLSTICFWHYINLVQTNFTLYKLQSLRNVNYGFIHFWSHLCRLSYLNIYLDIYTLWYLYIIFITTLSRLIIDAIYLWECLLLIITFRSIIVHHPSSFRCTLKLIYSLKCSSTT